MNRSTISTLALLVIAGLMLGACGGQSGNASQKVTSSGLICPEPSPRLEVTSSKLNLFVWTEYIIFDSDSPKTPLIAGDADLGVVWNGEAFLAQREMPSIQ